MTQTGSLRVWVLSDGLPGHFNHSRGIVAALRRLQPVEEHWIEVSLRAGFARNLLRGLLNRRRRPGPLWLLRLFYRFEALPRNGCDLIVSAGGKTSFANAWLAAHLGVANIFSGSLRRLSPQRFTLVLTPQALPEAANTVVPALPPSAIDSERLDSAAADFRHRNGIADQRFCTLLTGGNGAGYRYNEDDWQQLAQLLNVLAREQGIRWLVATSRRTGREGERILRERIDDEALFEHCWYGDGERFDAERFLGLAEYVMVTEDSMTMLTEAMYARRPVYSLGPRRAEPLQRNLDTLQRCEARGILRRFALSDLLRDTRALQRDPPRALQRSPLDELAGLLRQRLGGLVGRGSQ